LSPLPLTFLVELTASFAILTALLKPAASTSVRQRLSIIQESVRPHNAGAYASDLVARDQQGGSARFSAFLERYGFAKRLKLLLMHADSDLSVGATVLISAGSGLLCGSLCFYWWTSCFWPRWLWRWGPRCRMAYCV